MSVSQNAETAGNRTMSSIEFQPDGPREIPPRKTITEKVNIKPDQQMKIFVMLGPPGSRIRLWVAAEAEWEALRAHRRVTNYGPGFVNYFDEVIKLDAGVWYVVFANPSRRTVRISYKISIFPAGLGEMF